MSECNCNSNSNCIYNKRVWKDEEVIFPCDMNRIEGGIENAHNRISVLSEEIKSKIDNIDPTDSLNRIEELIRNLQTVGDGNSEKLDIIVDKLNDIYSRLYTIEDSLTSSDEQSN